MIRFRTPLLLAAAGFIVATASTPGQAPASKAYLLNVGKGQTFNDIGSDDKTKPEAVEDFKELGGKALKVAFFKGDSVGDRVAKVKNWKPFATLRVNVFNPGKDIVKLGLNIFHARSTNYNTRIEHPILLKPGKNEVTIGIGEFQNTNGSAPALTDIRRWYFADTGGNHRVDRPEQEVPLQRRHGLRPGAAQPEENRHPARFGRRRVGQGPLPGSG